MERMDDDRRRNAALARLAMLALLASTTACDEPAKSAADAQDAGTPSSSPVDRSNNADKSHCGGDSR